MGKKITIDPITRLEGHGKIAIFLDDEGAVENAYLQIPELRGFEKFCEGRPLEELPRITPRICGVCPTAHHLASAKATDACYNVHIPSPGRKLRELLNAAFYVDDHSTHFYVLAAPDYVVGPSANPKERNIIGLIGKVGVETGKKVLGLRKACQRVVEILGGKYVHPVCAVPGGMSKAITEEEREEIEAIAKSAVEFAQLSLQIHNDVVLDNSDYLELATGDVYRHETYYMGLVDENNHVNHYDGKLRIVDPQGNEVAKFGPDEYLDNIAEHVEPWTYLKFPHFKKVGWKGLVDGKDSGIFCVAPLGRLNAADGMSTPLANAEYQKFYETLGGKPVHHRLATHWARLIGMLNEAERMVALARDPEITSPDVRTIPTETPGPGVGIVEAPRGTLIHHYWPDEDGICRKANLIVGTTHNYAAICLTIKRAAQKLIQPGGTVDEGLLNMIEMGFRS
ncbi:MAG: Ni/Fe hydrogenase subunit alpha, partial [Armatimonadota bacterium]